MPEPLDQEHVRETVIWLVSKIKDEEQSGMESQRQFCKLNDFSAFETSQILQAMESEDRI